MYVHCLQCKKYWYPLYNGGINRAFQFLRQFFFFSSKSPLSTTAAAAPVRFVCELLPPPFFPHQPPGLSRSLFQLFSLSAAVKKKLQPPPSWFAREETSFLNKDYVKSNHISLHSKCCWWFFCAKTTVIRDTMQYVGCAFANIWDSYINTTVSY